MVGGSNFYFNRPRVARKTENQKKNFPHACLEGEEIWHMCSLPHFRDLKYIFKLVPETLQQGNKVIFRRDVDLLLPLG